MNRFACKDYTEKILHWEILSFDLYVSFHGRAQISNEWTHRANVRSRREIQWRASHWISTSCWQFPWLLPCNRLEGITSTHVLNLISSPETSPNYITFIYILNRQNSSDLSSISWKKEWVLWVGIPLSLLELQGFRYLFNWIKSVLSKRRMNWILG